MKSDVTLKKKSRVAITWKATVDNERNTL